MFFRRPATGEEGVVRGGGVGADLSTLFTNVLPTLLNVVSECPFSPEFRGHRPSWIRVDVCRGGQGSWSVSGVGRRGRN